MLKIISKKRKSFSETLLLILLLVFLLFPTAQLNAGSLTSVKDTLATSRPSANTTITGTVNIGDTTVPVTSTGSIMAGDSVTLCVTNTCATTETKIVASVLSPTQLALTVGVANGYTAASILLYKSYSKHTFIIVPRSTVTNGKFIITMPGDTSGGPNNGIPGLNGFGFAGIATTSNFSLSPGTMGVVSTSSPSSNIVLTIPFTGTISSGTAQTIVVGVTSGLFNPVKSAAQGTADTYLIQVDETDNSSNVIDTTQIRDAVIESVTVTATVVPSLNFTINAVAQSTSVAGTTTDAASTATSVPFGNLTVNTNRTVAQYLHIDTNSNSGYVITAQSDGSLRKTNGTVITDFGLTPAENNANNGFGYSLQDKTNNPVSFHYNDSARTFNSAGFSSSSPVTVMSNGAPATGDEGWVIYRVRTAAAQAQGVYQNVITYIATATY